MIGTVLLSVILATGIYFGCKLITDSIIKKAFLSDAAVMRNSDMAYTSLKDYIKKYNVKATDSKELSKWLKTRTYTYLFVYDNYENVFEAGWWVDSPEEDLEDEDYGYGETSEELSGRIDEDNFYSDAENRIIEFADGKYYVYLSYYGEQKWSGAAAILRLGLAFLAVLITLLVYNSRNIRRIKKLSLAVERVRNGEFSVNIEPISNDELGRLAIGVNDMKDSIIEKLEREKAAWDANAELITSMSHDIRTPLTSLIGYLDIIEGEKYGSEEELENYVQSCRAKAFQLKDLSDKLFQYFLVFGSPTIKKDFDCLDAEILFQQILIEHISEIAEYGYEVEFDFSIDHGYVKVDVSMMRRLFDNLFSNVLKYAQKGEPLAIRANNNGNIVEIVFDNVVATNAKKIESTKIGLKTCEKICSDLGGQFLVFEVKNHYVSKIEIPICIDKEDQKY